MSRLRRWLNDNPAWPTVACVVMPMLLWAVLSRQYAQSFGSEVTAWLVAAERAPSKPRPHLNLALSLMERQRYDEAWIVLDYTGTIVNGAHLMPWERQEAEETLLSHRMVLSRIGHNRGRP